MNGCSVPWCKSIHYGRGLCAHHYESARRDGTLHLHERRSNIPVKRATRWDKKRARMLKGYDPD